MGARIRESLQLSVCVIGCHAAGCRAEVTKIHVYFHMPVSYIDIGVGNKEQQMIEHTIDKIEARVKGAGALADEKRKELLSLLSSLREELDSFDDDANERADSITGFVGVSTHEATRPNRNPRLLDLSLEGLSSSVEDVEALHPRLAEVVNALCNMLSNLGI